MERDFNMPQGNYKVGRDIPEGVYLIAGLNDFSIVRIIGPDSKQESFHLEKENTKMVHVELEKGDILHLDGRVTMRLVTRFMEGDKCNLLEEVATFENELKERRGKKR